MRRYNIIKATLLITIIGVMAIVYYGIWITLPGYSKLQVDITEKEALRAGTLLEAFILKGKDKKICNEVIFQEETEQTILEYCKHLGIYKLRIFSGNGEIIYSTDKDETGKINDNNYFTEIVAKGIPYTKVVRKQSESAEGIVSEKDVVETYKPIVKNGVFKGAFELYYDISESRKLLDEISEKTVWTVLPFSLLILGAIAVLTSNANKNYEKIKEAERKLQIAYEEVENKVKNRTDELQISNTMLKKEVENRIEYERQLIQAASVFENTIEGIVITDRNGDIQRVNNAFTKITGYESEEVIGKNPRILKSDRHEPEFYDQMWESLKTRGMWEGEIWNRRKNGETYVEWLSINSIRDAENNTVQYVSLFHDITDQKRSEDRLHYQANYDALTGLPNRQLFNDRLKMAISHAKRNDLPVGILFLDIDDFKNVNDSLGHYQGDLLLQQVADRLTNCCREEDTVARPGGDEFLIIASFIKQDEPAATMLAERVLESFERPFELGKRQIYINASVGITLYPIDGADTDTLVKNADMAMYQAKNKGKNRFSLFSEEMNLAVMRQITLNNDLRKAISRNEFSVFYQPKVNISTGMVVGMEALVRWNRLGKEMVSPVEFIPLAEDNGVIYQMGEWVLSTACRQARKFCDICGRDIFMSVNLSVKQFQQKNLVTLIKKSLNEGGFSPELLTVEITESIVITDIEETIEILNHLKELGVHVSIDDFGTGYSSLSYLKKMPLSELKIDKTFIDDTPGNPEASSIVAAILSLAKSLNLKTVAEGVETVEQLAFLREKGCDEIQGYLFSKPIPAEEMMNLLKTGKNFKNLEM